MRNAKNTLWVAWYHTVVEERIQNGINSYKWDTDDLNAKFVKDDIFAFTQALSNDIFGSDISHDKIIGFDFNTRLKTLAKLYVDLLRAIHDNETNTVDNIRKEVKTNIDNFRKDFNDYALRPSWSQQIIKNLLVDIERQDNPDNRTVVRTSVERRIEVADVELYDVYITSNCDGWAEIENKFIGTTFDSKIDLKGKTETEAYEYLDDIKLLAEALLKLIEVGTITSTGFWTIDYDQNNSYIEFISELATNLINKDGTGADYKKVKELEKAIGEDIGKYGSIDVFAGDSDSFGWLTACLEFNGGIIVFG